ncbi:MAG: hypothetical protein ABI768_07175 [Acidobacteriota bacterium]
MKIRRPLAAALLLAGAVLALTADERVYGLMADGRTMLRTAVSIATLGEIGIARGSAVDVARPGGDAVSRYGMGASLVLVVPALLAPGFEKALGTGTSQTLFVLLQILLVLLAALSAGLLARAWGGGENSAAGAALATALSSPLWAYVALDFSEPLQAALCGGAFAAAAQSAAGGARTRRTLILAALAGFCAGFGLLTKSLLVLLFPAVLAALALAETEGRPRRLLAACAGFAPPAALWLAFEVVRFGRPFASYGGERFDHPLFDGLWRLLLGANKGLVFYFPLVLLAAWGAFDLLKARRAAARPAFAFAAALLAAAAAWWAWDGTFGWGPRLLLPAIPLLAAAAAVAPAPRVLFAALLAAGVAVNGLAALQPSTLTTWTFATLAPRPLAPADAALYPDFALRRGADGTASLYPQYFASREAALAPIPLAGRLLAARLSGRGAAGVDAALWKGEPAPAFGVAAALPASSLVHLTAPFRWPRLGMSFARRKNEADWSFAFVEALLDQALRAQDMGRADRALDFGERLFAALPNPETATVLAEGYRLARRPETLEAFAGTIRRKGMEPEFAVVLALAARDAGDAPGAAARMGEAAERSGRRDLQALAAAPPTTWPATLRSIQSAAGRMPP